MITIIKKSKEEVARIIQPSFNSVDVILNCLYELIDGIGHKKYKVEINKMFYKESENNNYLTMVDQLPVYMDICSDMTLYFKNVEVQFFIFPHQIIMKVIFVDNKDYELMRTILKEGIVTDIGPGKRYLGGRVDSMDKAIYLVNKYAVSLDVDQSHTFRDDVEKSYDTITTTIDLLKGHINELLPQIKNVYSIGFSQGMTWNDKGMTIYPIFIMGEYRIGLRLLKRYKFKPIRNSYNVWKYNGREVLEHTEYKSDNCKSLINLINP